MVRIKDGVTPYRLLVLVAAAANVAEILGKTVRITSGTDGKHMVGSKHYSMEAIDCKPDDWEHGNRQEFAEALRARLGQDYDVVVEDTHIHAEYDPE